MMIPHDSDIERVMRETGMGRLQAIRHLQQRREILRTSRGGPRYRVSPNSVFPLRGVDGRTFADRKQESGI